MQALGTLGLAVIEVVLEAGGEGLACPARSLQGLGAGPAGMGRVEIHAGCSPWAKTTR